MANKLGKSKWIMLLLLILVGGIFFIQQNWEIMQYKTGKKPVIIKYDGEDFGNKIFVLKNHNDDIAKLEIGMTDFYYVPKLKRLQFGIWYKKWKYSSEDRAVDIELADDAGQTYSSYAYTIHPNSGVYETFQSREVRDIDFDSIKTLTMNLRLLNKDQTISIVIFDKENDKLQAYSD